MTLTVAFVLLIVLIAGWKIRNWPAGAIIVSMMFAFALSADSAVRPAIDSLNQAFVNLVNSIGGSGGIV